MSRQSGLGYSPILRNRIFPSFFKICAGHLAAAGLLAVAIPNRPAAAFSDFQICAAQLERYAKVSPEAALGACSQALRPKDLSRCVVTISLVTPTLSQDALVACTKVRRPVDLSRCVLDITHSSRASEALRVIDYCRRSLLPDRFSECVVGLSRETDYPTSKALDTCIAAEDVPRNLSPNFAPPPPPTLTPNSLPNLTPIPLTPINPVNPSNSMPSSTTNTIPLPSTPIKPVKP